MTPCRGFINELDEMTQEQVLQTANEYQQIELAENAASQNFSQAFSQRINEVRENYGLKSQLLLSCFSQVSDPTACQVGNSQHPFAKPIQSQLIKEEDANLWAIDEECVAAKNEAEMFEC